MNVKNNLCIFNTTRLIKYITALFFSSGLAAQSSAVTIDFDDLTVTHPEYNSCWCDNPLTDQYLSKGLLIADAWVDGSNSQNAMVTSNFASLTFVGELPTFFSMNVTPAYDYSLVISIFGELGLIATKYTSGWKGSEEDYIPTIPNEFFSFNSPVGISHIYLESYANFRIGAGIDNLTFTHSTVPEPTPLILIVFGLAVVGLRRLTI
jgi:hypothetical protein